MVQNLQFRFSTEEEKKLIFKKVTEEVKERIKDGKSTKLKYINQLIWDNLVKVRGN